METILTLIVTVFISEIIIYITVKKFGLDVKFKNIFGKIKLFWGNRSNKQKILFSLLGAVFIFTLIIIVLRTPSLWNRLLMLSRKKFLSLTLKKPTTLIGNIFIR